MGDRLLERRRLRAQLLHLRRCGLTCRIASKLLLAGLEVLLRATVANARGNPLATTEFWDTDLAAQTFQHDADLLLRAELLPYLATDVLDDLFGQPFLCSGSVSHLHSFTVQMSQKSSVMQSCRSVPWALISDKR